MLLKTEFVFAAGNWCCTWLCRALFLLFDCCCCCCCTVLVVDAAAVFASCWLPAVVALVRVLVLPFRATCCRREPLPSLPPWPSLAAECRFVLSVNPRRCPAPPAENRLPITPLEELMVDSRPLLCPSIANSIDCCICSNKASSAAVIESEVVVSLCFSNDCSVDKSSHPCERHAMI